MATTAVAISKHGERRAMKNRWNGIKDTRVVDIRRRLEAARASKKRGPPPKRGDVKAAIVKEIVDTTVGFCCASVAPEEADIFLDLLEEAPFPTRSQPMANLWPSLDWLLLEEH